VGSIKAPADFFRDKHDRQSGMLPPNRPNFAGDVALT
jgi:hypothetical protein